ncbi:MAG: thiamine pyrophosphate-dependent enzyme, partial [Pseudomonadota bacterium]
AEQSSIPVVSAFRYVDQFDNYSEVYCGEAGVGMPAYIKQMLSDADLILAINVRFGEMSTDGYSLLGVPEPSQTLIHVHSSDAEIGKIYSPVLGVHCGPNVFAQSLKVVCGPWQDWCTQWRDHYLRYFTEVPVQPSPVDMSQVCAHLREVLPDDVIVTNGAGNFTVWPGKFIRYGQQARLLAPQSGAMGYGLPAAITAKLEYPERTVVCFAGDGDLQMNIQELATAAQSGACPIILVVNNGIYGTIRAHQETHYPARVFGTTMSNPDFVLLAQAYGFFAQRVDNTSAFAAAFERALASRTGALLDLSVSSEAISPFKRLSDLGATQ